MDTPAPGMATVGGDTPVVLRVVQDGGSTARALSVTNIGVSAAGMLICALVWNLWTRVDQLTVESANQARAIAVAAEREKSTSEKLESINLALRSIEVKLDKMQQEFRK